LARTEPQVDAKTFALLDAVSRAAGELGIEWMVTGAAGRVLLLEGVYGFPPGRATEDIDLGIMVENWERYQALVEKLCREHDFRPDPKQQQRIRLGEAGMLDLVPFGAIESGDRLIRWPPEQDFAMSVIGFREAHADAVEVALKGLTVPVVSPVGLMMLKLIAWSERHLANPGRDAADLAYVLRHFGQIVTEAAILDEHYAVVEACGYDIDQAASRVLGQRIAALAQADTWQYLTALLEKQLHAGIDSLLVREIGEQMRGMEMERINDILQSLQTGLAEGMNK
jgi:predicted nucleotidyltransferase